jgi:hypothetical protein
MEKKLVIKGVNLYSIVENYYFNQEPIESPSFRPRRDRKKSKIKTALQMKDYLGAGSLPVYSKIKCWWDHELFDSKPLGCPLGRNSKGEPITEGNFCGLSCVLAYSEERKGNTKYKNTPGMITEMSIEMFNSPIVKKAEHWSLLKDHGGHLTLLEFRNQERQIRYDITPNIKCPVMHVSSTIFQASHDLKDTKTNIE